MLRISVLFFAEQLGELLRRQKPSLLPHLIRHNFHKSLPTWITSQIRLIDGKLEGILLP